MKWFTYVTVVAKQLEYTIYKRDKQRKEGFDEQTLYEPVDIAGDSRGVLYVADRRKKAIVKFCLREDGNPPDHVQDIVHENLHMPFGLTIDSNDFIYVADTQSKCIIVFNSEESQVTILKSDRIQTPRGICSERGPSGHCMFQMVTRFQVM